MKILSSGSGHGEFPDTGRPFKKKSVWKPIIVNHCFDTFLYGVIA
jgi:hypothetical protein